MDSENILISSKLLDILRERINSLRWRRLLKLQNGFKNRLCALWNDEQWFDCNIWLNLKSRPKSRVRHTSHTHSSPSLNQNCLIVTSPQCQRIAVLCIFLSGQQSLYPACLSTDGEKGWRDSRGCKPCKKTRPICAEESRRKTLNPYELLGCTSAADPDLWPLRGGQVKREFPHSHRRGSSCHRSNANQ